MPCEDAVGKPYSARRQATCALVLDADLVPNGPPCQSRQPEGPILSTAVDPLSEYWNGPSCSGSVGTETSVISARVLGNCPPCEAV